MLHECKMIFFEDIMIWGNLSHIYIWVAIAFVMIRLINPKPRKPFCPHP